MDTKYLIDLFICRMCMAAGQTWKIKVLFKFWMD